MKIIAEIGWNHLGDIGVAKKMIDAADESGADYCKFQTWSVKNLKKGSWDNDGRREIYNKAELTYENHIELKKYCEDKNIKFLTSIFNIHDVNFLKKIFQKIIKIGSPEIYNIDLIKECLTNFNQVVLSTGAAKWDEIKRLKNLENLNKLILLHCVSSYPCKPENVNMPRMLELKKIVQTVGYSGHYPGIDDAMLAICSGAQFVEKHFTIDKNLPGRDNKFSILPSDLKALVKFKENHEKMKEFNGLDLQECEKDIYHNVRGRWNS